MTSSKVFCFGELLLRMSPDTNGRWINEAAIPAFIGGAELNVSTALSKWGISSRYSTAMPDNNLSAGIIRHLEKKGIDCSSIILMGDRLGIYYLPQGSDLKNAGVIYDRAHSSFSTLRPGMIDWDKSLDGCERFHFSAISPALNENIAGVCEEGLEAATRKGLHISVDLNYRAKLWQYGKKPAEVMPRLTKYCHVIMGNIWSVEQLLGIPATIADSTDKTHEQLNEAAGRSMRAIHDNYPTAESIAYTFRLASSYFALMQHGAKQVISKKFNNCKRIDAVGSGDCFMAGIIYGLQKKHDPEQVINYAAAAAVGKLQEKGDATGQTVESINHLLSEYGQD